MRIKWLVLLMVFLFLIEGTVMPWIIPGDWKMRIVPHFVFVMVLFFGMLMNRYVAMTLGLIFGLLHDVIHYGHMIGVYSFSMGVCGYLVGKLFESRRLSIGGMMFVIVLGNWVFDTLVYGIYTLFLINHKPYDWALIHHIIPSLFLQLLFSLIIYVPVRRSFENLRSPSREDESI